ncbi:MAG: DUF167 domain-containing protein [Candidatus Shapirobacteria bacterium]
MKISVIVHPNSKRPRIEADLTKILHVYVSASALEGKANQATTEALVKFFKVKNSGVILVKGEKSKNKVFEII